MGFFEVDITLDCETGGTVDRGATAGLDIGTDGFGVMGTDGLGVVGSNGLGPVGFGANDADGLDDVTPGDLGLEGTDVLRAT